MDQSIDKLPKFILIHIFSFLDAECSLILRKVCKKFGELS